MNTNTLRAADSNKTGSSGNSGISRRRGKLRLFGRILIGIVVIIGAFAIFVALKPGDYSITRSALINAPASKVFDQVNDFHNWETWSPWAKLDPAARNSFEGSASGTGAGFAWSGNDKVGEGRMTITQSHPNDLVLINLEFIKPFASTCNTEFTFKPQGGQTLVTWTMSGKNGFVAKAFCLFMNMDKSVGGDFERGLSQMKAVVEKQRTQTST